MSELRDRPGAHVHGAGGGRHRHATRSIVAAEAYERRLKLTDVIGFVAQNGYAREASRCARLCPWRS